jgi:hypothetical protein
MRLFHLLTICLLLSLPLMAGAGEQPVAVTVSAGGSVLDLHTELIDGIFYVPAFQAARCLQYNFRWDPSFGRTFIDGTQADLRARMEDGRLMISIESLARALGGSVEYIDKERCLRLILPGSRGSAAPRPTPGSHAAAPGISKPATTAAVQATSITTGAHNAAGPVSSPLAGASTTTAYAAPSDMGGFKIRSKYSGDLPVYGEPSASTAGHGVAGDSATGREERSSSPAPFPQGSASSPDQREPSSSPVPAESPGSRREHGQQMSSQPADTAYPSKQVGPDYKLVRPLDAPPKMPPNLTLPPVNPLSVPGKGYDPPKVLAAEGTLDDKYPSAVGYRERIAKNDTFSITVSNVEIPGTFKNFYKPMDGYKFVIIYLSQTNISKSVQIYTGRFSLLDDQKRSYDYSESMSNFWLMILREGASNFGYLVFEIPQGSSPSMLVLHALNQEPLTVNL